MFANPPPDLIRLYIRHVAIGFGIAAVFVGLLIGFDVAGLRHLILTSDKGWLAVLMLFLANGVVFAGVQFAIAVMGMAEDDDDDEPRGGLGADTGGDLQPVRVGARSR